MFFAGDEWHDKDETTPENFSKALQGTAVCFNTSWVPCPDCDCTDASRWGNVDKTDYPRCIDGTNDEGDPLTFVLKNNCGVPDQSVAIVNYTTLVLFLLVIVLIGFYLKKQEVKFDEDEQTAQDYSILISNPPTDAIDPEEWKKFFFEQCEGAQVTVCTCAVDNDLLIQTLVERREKLRLIKNALPPGTSMDMLNIARLSAEVERKRTLSQRFLAVLVPGIPENFARLSALNTKVQGLARKLLGCKSCASARCL